MRTQNILLVTVLIIAAVDEGMCAMCDYRNDTNSMFHWKGYENICSKSLCATHRWLKCDVSREYILDQAIAHYEHDILLEIEYMEKYFNTMIPRPDNRLGYGCEGVCQKRTESLQLQRLFVDVNTYPYSGPKRLTLQRRMCIVIGPNIYYQRCGGQCSIRYGDSGDSYCVPDVFVKIDIWVFCPDAKPNKCHKVKFNLPISCSCKKIRCKSPYTLNGDFIPNLPPKAIDWDPNNLGYIPDPKFFASNSEIIGVAHPGQGHQGAGQHVDPSLIGVAHPGQGHQGVGQHVDPSLIGVAHPGQGHQGVGQHVDPSLIGVAHPGQGLPLHVQHVNPSHIGVPHGQGLQGQGQHSNPRGPVQLGPVQINQAHGAHDQHSRFDPLGK